MAVNRFLYPRTIQVTRPQTPSTVPYAPYLGKQPYSGVVRDKEDPTLYDIPASIQFAGLGRSKGADVPSDAPSLAMWKILTPPGLLERDAIAERDIVTDEINKRYQVVSAYWSPLGYSLRATLLQV